MDANQNNAQEQTGMRPGDLDWSFYLAAAFGGFLVGFGELVRAGSETTSVTVLRVSAVLREQFSAHLGQGWIAMLLLALFASILCAIYRPNTHKEAFALGLSVFAILSSLTPQPQPRLQSDIVPQKFSFMSFIISEAHAQYLRSGESGDFYFDFTNVQNTKSSTGLISVFDGSEQHLLYQERFDTTKIARLRLPKGFYIVQFECNGCARVKAEVTVEKSVEAARIKLSRSRLPLSFQRLVSADTVDISEISASELPKIQDEYLRQMK